MWVGISTAGSWQSQSLLRVGSSVFSSHSHPCHSQDPSVLSLDHKPPEMDSMSLVYKPKGQHIHALYKQILE